MRVMSRGLLSLLASGLVVGSLAGCTGLQGSDSVVTEIIRQNGYPYIRTVARIGEMKTDVYGNPFGEDATAVRDRTIAAMQGHYKGAEIVFTNAPKAEDLDIHVVVALQPPDALHSPNLCADPGAIETEAAGGADARMSAALCVGTSIVAAAHLDGENPGSTASPAFDRQVGILTWNLMNLPLIDRDLDCDLCG